MDVPFVLYLNMTLITFFKEKTWSAETVIKIPNKKVEGWALPEMPGRSVYRHYKHSTFIALLSLDTCRFTADLTDLNFS